MNPEYLISRYLDGELTPQQDEELRQILANDSTAREIYEAALNLSINAREDAMSIETPPDLFEETEDLIMMKIMNEVPVIHELYPKRNLYPRYITSIAAVLLLAFVSISDFNFDRYFAGNSKMNSIQTMVSNVENQAPVSQENISRSKPIGLLGRGSHNQEIISGSGSSSMIVAANSTENSNTNIELPDGVNLKTEDQSNDGNVFGETLTDPVPTFPGTYIGNEYNNDIFSTKPGYISSSNNTISPANPFDDTYPKSINEVEFSTFLATSVVQNGSDNLKENVNTSISQSVAYSMKSGNKIGVEIGYTELTFDEEVTVNVPATSSKKTSSIESTNFNSSGEYVLSTMNLEHNRPMVWGAAFYEHRLFKTSGFSLNGRFGLGGATDGPVGFARFFARYEVIPAVSLTFGADARMIYSSYDAVPDYARGLMTSGSMIYGLQIRF